MTSTSPTTALEGADGPDAAVLEAEIRRTLPFALTGQGYELNHYSPGSYLASVRPQAVMALLVELDQLRQAVHALGPKSELSPMSPEIIALFSANARSVLTPDPVQTRMQTSEHWLRSLRRAAKDICAEFKLLSQDGLVALDQRHTPTGVSLMQLLAGVATSLKADVGAGEQEGLHPLVVAMQALVARIEQVPDQDLLALEEDPQERSQVALLAAIAKHAIEHYLDAKDVK
ncbi:hypothetical protein ACOTHJ_12925 [Achromobacter xylosoxidans]